VARARGPREARALFNAIFAAAAFSAARSESVATTDLRLMADMDTIVLSDLLTVARER